MTYIFEFYHKDTDSTEMDITQEDNNYVNQSAMG